MSSNVKNARFQSGNIGPGPAAYTLPTTVGYHYEGNPPKKVERQIPKMYSFGQRTSMRYNTIGPGPVPSAAPKKGEYVEAMTRHGKPASYKYSFGHRTQITNRDRKPGPMDCQPDSAKMKKEEYEKIERHTTRTGPLYSFGHRHADMRREMGPAANAYFAPDKDSRLLPNFLDVYKTRAPKYTFNSRLADPIRRSSPGAAAYHPYTVDDGRGKSRDRVDPTRPRAAEYSMRARTATNYGSVGPGPIVYDIRPFKGIKPKDRMHPTAVDGNRAPTWQFGQRNARAPMILPSDNC